MTGVVHELQVGARVVDGRVAAERVVRDVERVVRPRRDRQPRLVRRIEDGGRDLADASPEAGLQLAVHDHRCFEEALRGAALAGRRVERERVAGRDELVVDEVRDELHVVDAVRYAAVERLVGADRSRDPHGLRIGGRALRLRDRECERGNAVRAALGGGKNSAGRLERVEHEPGLGRDDPHAPVRRRYEIRISRRLLDLALQTGEEAVRRGTAKAHGRKVEHLRKLPTGDAQPLQAGHDGHGPRDDPRRELLLLGQARHGGVRLVDADGQADGSAREGRERAHDQRPGNGAIEHPAGRARGDGDVQAAAHELCLAMRRVDGGCEQVELVAQRGLVRLEGRDEVLREELELEPPVAAHEAETAALLLRVRDGRLPVDADPELPRRDRELPGPEREGDGHVRERFGALLEQPLGIRRRKPSHVDAGDARSVGELAPRPREDGADDQGDHSGDGGEDRQPGPEPATRGCTTASADGRGRGSHGAAHRSRDLVA